jgi:D-alanyl-D-alanine carboxypeptidase
MKKFLLFIVALVMLTGAGWYVQKHLHTTSPTSKTHVAGKQTSNSSVTQQRADAFDKTAHSTSDPASLWVIVNKQHPLQPKTYIPADLIVPNVPLRLANTAEQMHFRKAGQADLETLFADAKTAGLSMTLGSGYRSEAYQEQLYTGYIKSDGQAAADRSSARPGYSEHQTGLALDFDRADMKCSLEACFADTDEGKWLAANAYKYGFLLRYPADKEQVTGYEYEPWHYRYVGKELALELHDKHIETLEEFFGVSGGTTYGP